MTSPRALITIFVIMILQTALSTSNLSLELLIYVSNCLSPLQCHSQFSKMVTAVFPISHYILKLLLLSHSELESDFSAWTWAGLCDCLSYKVWEWLYVTFETMSLSEATWFFTWSPRCEEAHVIWRCPHRREPESLSSSTCYIPGWNQNQ